MESIDAVGLEGRERVPLIAAAGLVAFVALSALGALAGLWKLLIVSWAAFVAMAGGAVFGLRSRERSAARSVRADGLASGAMITSAAIFLVPQAISYQPQLGGLGIAVGIVAGYVGHTVGHRLTHLDLPLETTTAQLTAHALAAGIVIGTVYTLLPELGLLLGLSIVSHKGPAGYAAADRLRTEGLPVGAIALPAASAGITALLVGLIEPPSTMALNAVVFGFAAGIFLHIAMDFLPECETGGEHAHDHTHGAAHAHLDRLRTHAVASTVAGAGAVALAWLLIA
jgi:ZIP family zinc transporter